MRFISLQEARQEHAGHASNAAFDRWIRRFNDDHPEALILRRRGSVEINSLLRALQIDAEKYTPGFRAAKALRELANQW